jgi:hypothetical protein
MRPPDKERRRLGQPAASATPTSATKVPHSITDQRDGRADPRAIGELLNTWIGVKFDEVDALVDEAHAKVNAIPDRRVLAERIGEWILTTWMLEHDVKELKAEVARLKSGRPA